MKIRMLDGILGAFHGMYGVKRGDIVDIDDENAKRYIASGLATAVLKGELPQPYQDTEEAVALRDEDCRDGSRGSSAQAECAAAHWSPLHAPLRT